MASHVGVAGQPNHHASMELDLIAERAERDADERVVECGDSGGRKSDRDRVQRELQRIQPRAGDILPERNAMRGRIGIAADSDAHLDGDSDANRHADGNCNSDPDSDNAADGHAHADRDINSDGYAHRYGNCNTDADGYQHPDRDINFEAHGDADSGRVGELSRELLDQQRLGKRLHRGNLGE